MTGTVNHGGRDLARVARAIRAGGFVANLLDARQAHRPWPDIGSEGPLLLAPEAGRLDANAAVSAVPRSGRGSADALARAGRGPCR